MNKVDEARESVLEAAYETGSDDRMRLIEARLDRLIEAVRESQTVDFRCRVERALERHMLTPEAQTALWAEKRMETERRAAVIRRYVARECSATTGRSIADVSWPSATFSSGGEE